jgi:hypothetical protein
MPRWPGSKAAVCGARTRKGGFCQGQPCKGQKRCRMHGGASPQAKAAAERRVAEDKARKVMETYGQRADVDPASALLEEVQWTAGHVAWLRTKVQELREKKLVWGRTQVETADKGAGEFTGVDTTTIKAAEVNAWLALYQKERTHLLAVCKAAIAAGIEERRVRLAERQGDLIVDVLRKILGDLDLSPEQAAKVPEVAARRLRQMSELALAA